MHPALSPLTVPASWLYRAAVRRRNARFDAGRSVTKFDVPVISVGNITTGGTGKSPMVGWICEELLRAGRRPVIAMRGYASDAAGVSDEAAEYEQRFGEAVKVLANPDRTSALQRFLATGAGADCIVLDDGFQHRQIARDLDLVLIDATQDTFSAGLLPAGHLREPVESLKRADAVVITRAEARREALAKRIEEHHGRGPIAAVRHAWTGLTEHGSVGRSVHRELRWLDGKSVATCFGTGNPKPIESQLQVHGAIIRQRIAARDHQRYDSRMLARIERACAAAERGSRIDALVVTPKDWVKLGPALAGRRDWRTPIIVPRLVLCFDFGEDALRMRVLEAAGSRT